jgi:hypothetical protein
MPRNYGQSRKTEIDAEDIGSHPDGNQYDRKYTRTQEKWSKAQSKQGHTIGSFFFEIYHGSQKTTQQELHFTSLTRMLFDFHQNYNPNLSMVEANSTQTKKSPDRPGFSYYCYIYSY